MIKNKILAFVFAMSFLPKFAAADEGMWLPMFLNYEDMQKKGLKLTPEQIYDINNSSLKDAIVRLGGGFCTGEVISSQGLMLTNHHCGYSVVQQNSTEEHNYLEDGFWAMKKSDELPAGFSVSFLVRMEDVTKLINAELNAEMTESERDSKIKELKKKIESGVTEDGKYSAQIKSFYKGNEFYMFIYQTFDDVRLVGAPPSSIGKFGGDTDNWMWPRHTGDFTMFRIYADKDNNPAAYSENNIPYTPKHHLPISLNGVDKGDYAMIFGYPGSTDRYLTSYGVKLATEKDQPARVKIRRTKLDLYEEGQAKSEKVNIQYAAKHAQVSNYWKYFIGQTNGLKRLKVYEKKKAQEDAFVQWVNQDAKRKEKYREVIPMYEEVYKDLENTQLARTYLFESVFGIEMMTFGFSFTGLKGIYDQIDYYESKAYKKDESYKAASKAEQAEMAKNAEITVAALKAKLPTILENIKGRVTDHFKDYNMEIDRNVFAAMFKYYNEDITNSKHKPEAFMAMLKEYKGDYTAFANDIFEKSILSSQEKIDAFMADPSGKALSKDPGVELSAVFLDWYQNGSNALVEKAEELRGKADRLYVAGLREMQPDKAFFPDANSTMRVTYGNVLDYFPKDAVYYNYFTTLEGVMEKEDAKNPEFEVEPKLKDLYMKKDYGQYAREDGKMQVCFISNNDITGGNSGSPVINGSGQLIGTAFDGNWEAMSGDIAFEPNLQRTISVDIRYTLFIIDKYAGAKHLIDEMTIVKGETEAKSTETEKKKAVEAN